MLKPADQRFFDIEQNVRDYIEAREGMDGKFLIEILKKHLKPKSKVLELGMGDGKDLDILNEIFNATGSDNSKIFLDIYKQKTPTADLLLLDAVTLKTKRKFDCIYSNKVLHHLTLEDLKKSLKKQKVLLKNNGILFHTFWHGGKKEQFQDLNFIHYKIDELKEITAKDFNLIEIDTYKEMVANDSFYIILQNPWHFF
jgi:cyclopropane fatty-acyl-phospholipid synthase-like methyltransferase